MEIEIGKEYLTRDGKKVRIYAIDGASPKSIHGAYCIQSKWLPFAWYPKGHAMLQGFSEMDIVNEYKAPEIGSICAFWNQNSHAITIGKLTRTEFKKGKTLYYCGRINHGFNSCEQVLEELIPTSFDAENFNL